MFIRVIFVLFIFSGACRSGEIPCPEAKKIKMHKSGFNRTTVSKKRPSDSSPSKAHNNNLGGKHAHTVSTKNIDVEEWDCPRSGTKKVLLPKSIKNNIRRNGRKINAVAKRSVSDSVRTHPGNRHR